METEIENIFSFFRVQVQKGNVQGVTAEQDEAIFLNEPEKRIARTCTHTEKMYKRLKYYYLRYKKSEKPAEIEAELLTKYNIKIDALIEYIECISKKYTSRSATEAQQRT